MTFEDKLETVIIQLRADRDKLLNALNEIQSEINTPNRGTCDYFIVDRIEEIINTYKAENEYPPRREKQSVREDAAKGINDNNVEIEQLTNKDWTELIAKQFNVSKSRAKDMLHAMHSVYERKKCVDEAIARDRVLPKKGHSSIRENFEVNDVLNQDNIQKGLGE